MQASTAVPAASPSSNTNSAETEEAALPLHVTSLHDHENLGVAILSVSISSGVSTDNETLSGATSLPPHTPSSVMKSSHDAGSSTPIMLTESPSGKIDGRTRSNSRGVSTPIALPSMALSTAPVAAVKAPTPIDFDISTSSSGVKKPQELHTYSKLPVNAEPFYPRDYLASKESIEYGVFGGGATPYHVQPQVAYDAIKCHSLSPVCSPIAGQGSLYAGYKVSAASSKGPSNAKAIHYGGGGPSNYYAGTPCFDISNDANCGTASPTTAAAAASRQPGGSIVSPTTFQQHLHGMKCATEYPNTPPLHPVRVSPVALPLPNHFTVSALPSPGENTHSNASSPSTMQAPYQQQFPQYTVSSVSSHGRSPPTFTVSGHYTPSSMTQQQAVQRSSATSYFTGSSSVDHDERSSSDDHGAPAAALSRSWQPLFCPSQQQQNLFSGLPQYTYCSQGIGNGAYTRGAASVDFVNASTPNTPQHIITIDSLAHLEDVCFAILTDAQRAHIHYQHQHHNEENCNPLGPAVVALDLEGRDLGRNGTVCIITLATVHCVYIIDLVQLGAAALSGGSLLRVVLESSFICKLMFDCRADCDALFFLYNVRLSNVCDLQVASCYSVAPHAHHLPGMKDVFRHLGLLAESEASIKEMGRACFDPKLGGTFEHWETRPLAPLLIQYCAVDVKHFFAACYLLEPYVAEGCRVGEARLQMVCEGQFDNFFKGNAMRDF